MPRLVFLVISISVIAHIEVGYGQIYLDSLYTLARHESRGEMILVDEDEFIVVGSARDTTTGAVGALFSRFSMDGELLLSNYYFDGQVYLFICNDPIRIDSFLFVSSASVDRILKYNINTGEIVDQIEMVNDFYADAPAIPIAMDRVDSSRIIVNNTIWGTPMGGVHETQLTILNTMDGSMRHIHNAYPGYKQTFWDVKWRGDRIYLGGKIIKGDPEAEGFITRATAVVLDTVGNEIWRYVSPEDSLRGGYFAECIVEEDGEIIIPYSFYRNYKNGTWNPWYAPTCRPGIGKIGANGELLWETAFGKPMYNDDGFVNHLRAAIPATHKDGYIVAGGQSNFSIEEYWAWPAADTISTGEYFQDDAIIAKISNDGEMLWTRTYDKVDGLFSWDYLIDIAHHPAGGYLLSGMAVEYPGPGEPLAQTWILHVDEYGCVVPGCQDAVSTEDQDTATVSLLIYPNPASSELYVYQAIQGRQRYIVSDVQGRIMESFTGGSAGHTFILDISDYPPGKYVVSRSDEEGEVVSVQWIKL